MPNRNYFDLNDTKELIRACINGNRIMQSRLYCLYAPMMKVVCLRYARNNFEAEEILQEGFIRVFECLPQYKFKAPLKSWMRKIMVNCALQKLRVKNLMYPVKDFEELGLESIHSDPVSAELNAKELITLIQSLPLMCRLVFNLYVFEGLKHREIAFMLGISEGTSKSNLFDARRMLQQRLKAEDSVVAKINA